MSLDNISLMRGGAVHRFLSWTGALRPRLRVSRLIALLIVVTAFVPLVIACAMDGTLYGTARVRMPLLGDYAVMSRLLLALPLLVLAAPLADHLLRTAIRQMSRGGFVRNDQHARFQHMLATAQRLRDAWWPELLMLVIALLPLASGARIPELAHLSTWSEWTPGHSSWAGIWFEHVAAPLFRFVGLLWLWRFALWTWMLWRFARLDLDLRAAHPDTCGGLAFLGLAQMRFASLAVAGSLIICGSCINHFLYSGQGVASLKLLLGGWVVASVCLLLAPLLLLGPPATRAKRHALNKYAILGHRAVRHFDERWKRGEPADNSMLIDSANPSALADFAAVYSTVADMGIFPVQRRQVIGLVLAAALPLVPLVFFVMSLDELASKLASMLI